MLNASPGFKFVADEAQAVVWELDMSGNLVKEKQNLPSSIRKALGKLCFCLVSVQKVGLSFIYLLHC